MPSHDVVTFLDGPVSSSVWATPLPATFRLVEGVQVLRNGFGGAGRISGTVKVAGTPNYPVARLVRLFRDRDGALVDQTTSSAIDGAYEFAGVDPAQRYTVIAYDAPHNFRAVVADNLAPDPL